MEMGKEKKREERGGEERTGQGRTGQDRTGARCRDPTGCPQWVTASPTDLNGTREGGCGVTLTTPLHFGDAVMPASSEDGWQGGREMCAPREGGIEG